MYTFSRKQFRKKALLLGHYDGKITTDLDLKRMCRFLSSPYGGCWDKSEIDYAYNVSQKELMDVIDKLRTEKLDYLFFYFSGHGGFKRTTFLELNPKHECINETEIYGIATRQLNIFDCCRSFETNNLTGVEDTRMFSEVRQNENIIFRNYFNTRILQAVPQQMFLYACNVGEYAMDRGNGGIFTNNLLFVVLNYPMICDLTAFETCFYAARQMYFEQQHPCYCMRQDLPRDKQLIFALNPQKILEYHYSKML